MAATNIVIKSIKDIRELTVDELNQQIVVAQKELFEAKMKHSLQQLENTALLSQLKNRIAQIRTVLHEKQAS